MIYYTAFQNKGGEKGNEKNHDGIAYRRIHGTYADGDNRIDFPYQEYANWRNASVRNSVLLFDSLVKDHLFNPL